MEIVTISIIFMVVVVFSSGFLIGNWFPVLKPFLSDDQKTTEDSEDAEDADGSSSTRDLVDDKASAANLQEKVYPGLLQVMRVFRDEKNYRLALEIDGQLLRRDQPLELDHHSQVSLIAAQLGDWLGFDLDIPKLPPAPELPKQPTLVKEEPEAGKKPLGISLNPLNMVTNAMKANAALPPKARDIADEINEILQEQLQGTPLNARGIEITRMSGKGLRFVVGVNTYEFIDEIDDADIQAVLQAAIRAWEGQQEDE
jgi:hypothetical protein